VFDATLGDVDGQAPDLCRAHRRGPGGHAALREAGDDAALDLLDRVGIGCERPLRACARRLDGALSLVLTFREPARAPPLSRDLRLTDTNYETRLPVGPPVRGWWRKCMSRLAKADSLVRIAVAVHIRREDGDGAVHASRTAGRFPMDRQMGTIEEGSSR
jgi:hypothetical protein